MPAFCEKHCLLLGVSVGPYSFGQTDVCKGNRVLVCFTSKFAKLILPPKSMLIVFSCVHVTFSCYFLFFQEGVLAMQQRWMGHDGMRKVASCSRKLEVVFGNWDWETGSKLLQSIMGHLTLIWGHHCEVWIELNHLFRKKYKFFPKVKLPGEWNYMLSISTSATFVVRERPTHTRSWNLEAALGPKPCKVNQQYQRRNITQHVLAERGS